MTIPFAGFWPWTSWLDGAAFGIICLRSPVGLRIVLVIAFAIHGWAHNPAAHWARMPGLDCSGTRSHVIAMSRSSDLSLEPHGYPAVRQPLRLWLGISAYHHVTRHWRFLDGTLDYGFAYCGKNPVRITA